jgi:hypothetical protein
MTRTNRLIIEPCPAGAVRVAARLPEPEPVRDELNPEREPDAG